jgi:hypothetical protein
LRISRAGILKASGRLRKRSSSYHKWHTVVLNVLGQCRCAIVYREIKRKMTELAKSHRIDDYSVRLARHKLYTFLSEIISMKTRYSRSGIKLSNWKLAVEV